MLSGAIAFGVMLLSAAHAALPFNSATVTKVENKVSYGEIRGNESAVRPATVADVVRANNYLRSQADSRAELQYPDGSLVRIGQNTVFSFDASSRTLSLEKGTFIFYVPKGSGGGTIKTPSLTAAITGTAGKVSPNTIAIIEGTVRLVPSGRLVHAGEFARRNPDGTITIARFNPAQAFEGKLVTFNGIMPGFEEKEIVVEQELPQFDLRYFEVLQRTQNLPSAIEHFFPTPDPQPVDRKDSKVFVPPPTQTPSGPGRGNGGGNNY